MSDPMMHVAQLDYLETLARNLRAATIQPTEEWSAMEREEWLAVARHVQQLQREAWIAGRDAAAKEVGIAAQAFNKGTERYAFCMMLREGIAKLKPPAQEIDR